MNRQEERAALLVIDLERGFIDESSPLCIRDAAATLPACGQAITYAREEGVPVFFIHRACIRTTCYDGLSLDYNVGILTDCCSSNREDIQQANLVDMANIGATLMTCAQFCDGKQATDWTGLVQAELL